MKKIRVILLALLCIFIVDVKVYAQLVDLLNKSEKFAKQEKGGFLSSVKPLDIDPILKEHYKEKFLFTINQPIDHSDLSKGFFNQRVIVAVADFNAPTVIVTEGYGAKYALNPKYVEEVSKLFKTNLVVVEHRYFLESTPFMQDDTTITPESLDWSYMTAVNHAADLHNVNKLFKSVFKGKWIATGISKGGQTAMFYTAYYPNDIDISVPYVGPLCRGVEDGRHEPFLAKFAGTKQEREIILNFQKELLKRRAEVIPLLKSLAEEEELAFRISLDEVFDYCVLEFPFAFRQWGLPVSAIPSLNSSTEDLFNFMCAASGPDYFATGGDSAPFFVQAAKELGYYGYDTKPFKGLLTIKSAKGYLDRIFLPVHGEFKFDKYLYKKISSFLATTDSKMMFIYGEFDPWSAVMPVAPVKNEKLKAKGKGRENMVLFVSPAGSHRARISNLPEADRIRAINILKSWLE